MSAPRTHTYTWESSIIGGKKLNGDREGDRGCRKEAIGNEKKQSSDVTDEESEP